MANICRRIIQFNSIESDWHTSVIHLYLVYNLMSSANLSPLTPLPKGSGILCGGATKTNTHLTGKSFFEIKENLMGFRFPNWGRDYGRDFTFFEIEDWSIFVKWELDFPNWSLKRDNWETHMCELLRIFCVLFPLQIPFANKLPNIP